MKDDATWRGIRVQTVITVAVMLALFSTGGVAYTLGNTVPVQAGVVIGAQDGPLVVFEEPADGDAHLRDPWVDPNTIEYSSTAGNMTVSSNGPTNATVVDIVGPWTRTDGISTNGRALTLDPEDKQAVTVDGGVTAVDWQAKSAIAADDGTADFRYAAGSSGTLEIGGLPANSEFAARGANGQAIAEFTTDGNGQATISLPSSSETDVEIISVSDPAVVSGTPADGANLESSNTTLSATIEDADFATADGDSVDVEITLNGAVVKTATLTSNGTVSVDVEPPLSQSSTWDVSATDTYDQSDTLGQRSFAVPAQLKIYSETNTSQLLDDKNISLEVRFFPLSDTDGEVVTREPQNAIVNLTGLPADERFVVTVQSEGTDYRYRRIVIDSLYETSRIYLLDESVQASETVFELQDPTGEFPPTETILYVEKPIQVNNETRYQVIAGDTFGATSTFPSILQNDARYRLRVATTDGESERVLGFYSVYGSSREVLQIQRIEPSAENISAATLYGGLEGSGNDTQLAIRYLANNPNTTVEYNVTNGTGVTIVPTTTTTASSFAHVYPVAEGGRYVVNYTITYPDGATESGSFSAGQIPGIRGRFNIDGQVLSLISWVAILSTLGLVVIVNRKLAPIAGVGMATALTIIGTIAIPSPVLGVAGAVAVLTLFGGQQ